MKKNKKKNLLKKIFLFSASLTICFITYLLCYFIAEKYFFDKFFYQKSTKYGYWLLDKDYHIKSKIEDFGKRSKDLIDLSKSVPIKLDKKKYNIAIFGDSLTWGQGVKNNQRFPVLLEKKLNKIKPTKIYSFASSGDNIFDHYLKYKQSLETYGDFDLYIFAIYSNDLEFNSDNRYDSNEFIEKLSIGCSGNKIYGPFAENYDDSLLIPEIETFKTDSFNFCSFTKLIPLLPKEKSIYIDLGNIYVNWAYPMQPQFKEIVLKYLNSIEPDFLQICNKNNYCQVSQTDQHPSYFIQQRYTNILFDEITTNHNFNK